MKRAIAALLLVLAACGSERTATQDPPSPSSVAPTVAPTPTPRPTPDAGQFDLAKAMNHVEELAVNIGKREGGTDGERRGASYIAGEIEAIGWDVEQRPFPVPQGGNSVNVVGTPPGFTEDEPYLLVGGHQDSINGPGANDNATGIAIMLDIARAVEVRAASYPVMVVAFGAEERQPAPGRPHHVGSRHYVDEMSPAARENLVAMVNLDMVGNGSLICGRMSVGPREGTERCLRVAKELGIPARERVTPDWSDNGSFLTEDMNAAWLWTGELPCCYHNPRDTIDAVRPGDLRRSGRLALAIVRSYKRSS